MKENPVVAALGASVHLSDCLWCQRLTQYFASLLEHSGRYGISPTWSIREALFDGHCAADLSIAIATGSTVVVLIGHFTG